MFLGEAAKAFLEVAGGNDDLKFALGTADIAAEYKVEGDAIVLFKKFDEGRNDLTEGLTDVEGIFLFFKKKWKSGNWKNEIFTILESVNPQYDERLFNEFPEKYKFRTWIQNREFNEQSLVILWVH